MTTLGFKLGQHPKKYASMKLTPKELAKIKDAHRRKDARELAAGKDGREIARRNGVFSPETIRKARIQFA